MNILLAGGSGLVGSFITPYLSRQHNLRVLDTKPPRHKVEFVEGSVTNHEDVLKALEGMDTFIWLVMLSPQGGSLTYQDPEIIANNFDVNCKGLHTFLWTAQQAGMKHGVYTSTMSVHYRGRRRYRSEETVPLDTPSPYGLSKGFGELICQYFARWFDMNIIGLRITAPRTREQWIQERKSPRMKDGNEVRFPTDEEDLANAFLAAVEVARQGNGRFEPIFIVGDENEIEHNLTKAKRILGWEPKTHLKVNVHRDP